MNKLAHSQPNWDWETDFKSTQTMCVWWRTYRRRRRASRPPESRNNHQRCGHVIASVLEVIPSRWALKFLFGSCLFSTGPRRPANKVPCPATLFRCSRDVQYTYLKSYTYAFIILHVLFGKKIKKYMMVFEWFLFEMGMGYGGMVQAFEF